MNNPFIQTLCHIPCEIGESPIWLASAQTLFWVDTEDHRIHQYSLATKTHRATEVPVAVTAIAPARSGWLAATKTGLYRCQADFTGFEFIADPTEGLPGIRLNDAVNCPNGDLWFGSMNEAHLEQADGCLYRYEAGTHRISQIDSDYAVANGIAFNATLKRAYVANMFRGQVIELQMSDDWTAVLNKRVLIQLPEQEGLPDGLTTDAHGNLYVCHWNKGAVSVYNPQGHCIHLEELPVKHATRCTFGGDRLDMLFVTTGWYGMSEQDRSEQPLSGCTFVLPAPFSGKADSFFSGSL
ncbi:SMP-30/gluconolactonase/LRE family protein [Photobacterium sp. TLY01]|uniref:SMP-30/gluconolactonase/LRE family protein n=1 Tax=Photobacterium sp. TLY01 TaxID=2907534 RepID=UPI001F487254|nr:SMP-30/gluconolactonase/LRE family protein [Photobacterium sp. TLY01]UIP30625.1 SMP-30/gluconolactonase/LRE family protein [Photobacterium sp. TLY01]